MKRLLVSLAALIGVVTIARNSGRAVAVRIDNALELAYMRGRIESDLNGMVRDARNYYVFREIRGKSGTCGNCGTDILRHDANYRCPK